MARALALAARALGNSWPNPAVGCVIVRDGAVVGEGWTAPGGRPHAETQALDAAGAKASGATAYVSLEPCAHHGLTPPCADAMERAGIARCVIATGDPDPRVAGRGIARLRDAGIAVEVGLMADEASALNEGFFTRIARGRPWLTLKLASSLDGRIALGSGVSRWITGPEARGFVHGLRARHDAVMIGAGTARADDPTLDVREGHQTPRQPVRIVADSTLSLPLTGRLAATARHQPLWLLHGPGVARDRAQVFGDIGVELLGVPTGEGGVLDLVAAMGALGARGLTRVLCEGGGQLAAGLIRSGLVDELILMTSGKVIGGDGIPAVAAMGATDLGAVPRFVPIEHRQLGPDLMSRWRPAT
ncbi:bifunctional diaminohydroxyphosphoribosylaminopyrimidine deaminase/5-amino-6-(5-phosphoribosylamino)uracil reductase RibD [Halovulum dunhuangense]|uniref:Riboflavin biosynthesis protein RibD n=1 Tax=Halovulum dunhuangense TaxID=1505036 RepID=A0A849L5S6_9RHOB|nr:bifunctional diaminohydroxyphosphoribosylaminopyrimidine deaminase/5-amino-6-(5-phosphoribosylamino)uracil reductase RibD [Halovulum dunhuangense]NNU81514.1 bifunctional diaminohydroxyphosphoribosylaminopyrimidine deaminase/5-amino-6-(5-phosphoribosylamino)uracil reductase RibD [Halovulum dunhuangense]